MQVDCCSCTICFIYCIKDQRLGIKFCCGIQCGKIHNKWYKTVPKAHREWEQGSIHISVGCELPTESKDFKCHSSELSSWITAMFMKKEYGTDSDFQTTHHFCFFSASSASSTAVHAGLRGRKQNLDQEEKCSPHTACFVHPSITRKKKKKEYLFHPLYVCKALHSGRLS